MKPFEHVRKGEGYCCIWCDGPYAIYKKRNTKQLRKSERQSAKKDIKNEIMATKISSTVDES